MPPLCSMMMDPEKSVRDQVCQSQSPKSWFGQIKNECVSGNGSENFRYRRGHTFFKKYILEKKKFFMHFERHFK